MTMVSTERRGGARAVSVRTLRASVARAVVLAAIGYLIAGSRGAVIAGLATLIGAFEPRLVALYALVGVVLTGLLTVIDDPLQVDTGPFDHLPAAAFVGRLAAPLFLAAVVGLWADERSRSPAPDPMPAAAASVGPTLRSGWSGRFVPVAVFCLGAALVLNVSGDGSLRWVTAALAGIVLVVGMLAGHERRTRRASSPSAVGESDPSPR